MTAAASPAPPAPSFTQFCVQLEPDVADALREIAIEECVGRADVLRLAINALLEQRGKAARAPLTWTRYPERRAGQRRHNPRGGRPHSVPNPKGQEE